MHPGVQDAGSRDTAKGSTYMNSNTPHPVSTLELQQGSLPAVLPWWSLCSTQSITGLKALLQCTSSLHGVACNRRCPEAKEGHVQGSAGGCSVLTHPLEPLVPLQAEEGGCDVVPMQGERIVWSSRELPYIATYNQVS